jgi:hypothetical protein
MTCHMAASSFEFESFSFGWQRGQSSLEQGQLYRILILFRVVYCLRVCVISISICGLARASSLVQNLAGSLVKADKKWELLDASKSELSVH